MPLRGRRIGPAKDRFKRSRKGISWVQLSHTAAASSAVFDDAEQGSGYGYSGVRGLNALLATLTTKDAAPVIVAPTDWSPHFASCDCR